MALSRILAIAITGASMSAQAAWFSNSALEFGSDRLHKIVAPTPAPQAQPVPPAPQPGVTRTSSPSTQATGSRRGRKEAHAEWKRNHWHKHHHAHWNHHHGRPDFSRVKFERPERPERHGHRH